MTVGEAGLRDPVRWMTSMLVVSAACGALLGLCTTAQAEGGAAAEAEDNAAARPPLAVPAAVAGDIPGPAVALGQPAAYEAEIDLALHEYALRNYQEARVHLAQAHRIFPNARTLRGLGNVEFELRNYGEAVQYLRAALGSDVRPLDPELRAETEKILRRAAAYVGEVHVEIQPNTATVMVDGTTIASGPSTSLALMVGDHVLEFHALGRISERRVVRVVGGEQASLRIVLELADSPGAPHSGRPQPFTQDQGEGRTRDAPLYKKWWLWTAVGAVVAATAVGLALGLRAEPATQVDPPQNSPNTPEGIMISGFRLP